MELLKPKKGLVIRDPYDGFSILPAEGKLIDISKPGKKAYWNKKISSGDVEIVKSTKKGNA